MAEPKPSGGLLRFFALCFVPLPGIILLTLLHSTSSGSFFWPLAFALWIGCTFVAATLHCADRSPEGKKLLQPPGIIFLLYMVATPVVSFAIFFVGCLSSFHM